ncbi:MAG: polyprenyl synthetase family protein [Candidatus Diapherotrites archaeon]|uniref:Polyprenyl synthetase family protein n=1 Tax=Candidatus Iainarchaeum sp. TaxID=3101447 RepID=A0A939C5X6_9ARCH|nr:polyprenyl synthetase family protein [Candidatus Diapherotrites archaeon]
MEIKQYLEKKKPIIDREIEKVLPRKVTQKWLEHALGKAAYAYAVETVGKSMAEPIWEFLDRGGKRWRPALALLSCEAVGGKEKDALPFAPLVELAHNGCVTEDTLIWGADGIPKKIAEFKKGEVVLSVASDGSIVSRPIAETYDNGIKKVFKVKTRNREIVATENHPFLVISKNQPTRMELTEYGRLMVGLRVAQLGYTISEFCRTIYPALKQKREFSFGHLRNALSGYKGCLLPNETADIIASTLKMDMKKCWLKKKCLYEKAEMKLEWKELKELKKNDLIVVSKEILAEDGVLPEIPKMGQSHKDRNKIPKEFSMEIAQLAGFILGDGSIDPKGRVCLCIPEGAPGRKEYAKLVEEIFEAKPSLSKHSITICSKAIAQIFAKLGFAEHALEKEIPNWVFALPKSHRLAFVRGYLDSDGTVGKSGIVRFECANKKIITKLKALLDGMGFNTGKVCERTIDNTHFKKYIKKKETTLYSISLSSRNRVLEEIGSEITEYRSRLGRTAQRMVAMKFRDAVPNLPLNFSKRVFGFNRILQIEPAGEQHTYDLQIEETHNYISNGIITHNTIMIDDIEDDSKDRRGKPCTHLLYGIDIACNDSNALYFLGLTALYRNTQKLGQEKLNMVYNLYSEEMLRVCTGQAMDILWHKGKKADISEKEYLQMVVYKTGVLARLAAKLGAILGNGNEKQVDALGRFGEAIGIGFQIQDDILELTGEEFRKGKGSIGGDVHEGKRSLLVIKTLENAPKGEGERLLEILDSHPTEEAAIEEAIEIIKRNGAIEYAGKRAKSIVEKAWKEIEKALPESEAKKTLHSLALYCTEREI